MSSALPPGACAPLCCSFGVVLWEVVTGEHPHRGSMRLPRVPDECPAEVTALIQECMAMEPSARPTAQQLLRRLEVLGCESHLLGVWSQESPYWVPNTPLHEAAHPPAAS